MDPYVYPGTNILRNLHGIRDPELFDRFEADASSNRLSQLERKPTKGSFDAAHLRTIHRHIFQDVFDWAGKFRTVNISKSGDSFAFHDFIASCLDSLCAKLQKEQHLAGLDMAQFAKRAAFYLGEINAIHPFREGNGRSQREFFRQLAFRNGYALDWKTVTREQMLEASIESFKTGRTTGLEAIIRGALRPKL